jgi:hypothetical protein
MTTATQAKAMLPRSQWRVLNILNNARQGVQPAALDEPALAEVFDAELVSFIHNGLRYRPRRRGDGFDLGAREWPTEARVLLTGRGMAHLRDNRYQHILVALHGLGARRRPVTLLAAMREAHIGSGDRDLYGHLADRGLVTVATAVDGRDIRPDQITSLPVAYLQVALTSAGMNVLGH